MVKKALNIAFGDDEEFKALLERKELLKRLKLAKGEKGDSPTAKEITDLIKPLIPDPIPGKDYVLTKQDKEEIASQIEMPIVDKVIEKHHEVVKEVPIVREIALYESPNKIAEKLNTLEEVLDTKVLKDTKGLFDGFLKEIKSKKLIDRADVRNMPLNMNDQRWHGGGLTKVTHDTTLSGEGTPTSPLSVVTTSSGINSLNADFTTNQFLVTGTSGTDFAIADNGTGTHTFNLPTASAANRGALSSTDWSTFNNKQAAGSYITALTGDVTASGPGSVPATIANNAVTYAKMQAVSTTSKLLGSSSTTTPVQELTIGTGLTLTGTTLTATGTGGTVTSVASADGSITVTNPTSTVDLAVVKAPKLSTGRTISISGDLTYTSPSFDGSANVTAAGTLASVISAGGPTGSATVTPIITYDAKGRLTTVSSATITPAVGSITGLGTGVGTALAVNVGSAGAFITFNGAGGTPSSLVGTNISGTAASLTAGKATILATARTIAGVSFDGSANISIASTGLSDTANIAYLASANTFTGGKQTIATTVNEAFLINGGGTDSEYMRMTNTGGDLLFGVDRSTGGDLATGSLAYATVLTAVNATALQFGTTDIIRMTISSGGNVGIGTTAPGYTLDVNGITNVRDRLTFATVYDQNFISMQSSGSQWGQISSPSANAWTLGYAGSDTSTPGTVVIKWALGTVFMPTIGADTGVTDNSVCIKTGGTGQLLVGSGTLGICLGTSSERFKHDINDLTVGLDEILKLQPKNFYYKEGYGDSGIKKNYGLIAEEMIDVLPDLVGLDEEGKPSSADLLGLVPVLVKAVQQQQAVIEVMEARLETLMKKKHV